MVTQERECVPFRFSLRSLFELISFSQCILIISIKYNTVWDVTKMQLFARKRILNDMKEAAVVSNWKSVGKLALVSTKVLEFLLFLVDFEASTTTSRKQK